MRLNSSTNGEHRRFPPRQCALNRHAQQALPSILRRRDVPVPSSLFSTASPIPMEQPFSAPGLPHKRYIRTDTSYASKDVRAPPKGFPNIKKALPKSQEGFAQSIAGWSTTRPSANERGTSMIRWLRDPRNRMIKDFSSSMKGPSTRISSWRSNGICRLSQAAPHTNTRYSSSDCTPQRAGALPAAQAFRSVRTVPRR